MNGCISDVFKSCFSYRCGWKNHVCIQHVVFIRKSNSVNKSICPRALRPCSLLWVSGSLLLRTLSRFVYQSRYFKKYSCPLPDEPKILERHTNILRGKFWGFQDRYKTYPTNRLLSHERCNHALMPAFIRLHLRCLRIFAHLWSRWCPAHAFGFGVQVDGSHAVHKFFVASGASNSAFVPNFSLAILTSVSVEE